MAVLRNINSNIEFHFILKKSKEKEWLNYKVEVYVIDHDNRKKFLENISLVNEDTLFLDALYDPEVPQLVTGISKILNGEGDYFLFSPVDDKDFILELKRGMDFYISFFPANNLSNFWEGIRIVVDRAALNNFMIELTKENEELCSDLSPSK